MTFEKKDIHQHDKFGDELLRCVQDNLKQHVHVLLTDH